MLSLSVLAVSLFGTIVAAADCPSNGSSIVAHSGTPVGKVSVQNGVSMYISEPSKKTDKAVLYLTDVFGIQLAENKLLADSFARAGFLTVAPDLFNATPAPSDINVPTFNTAQFLGAHGVNETDPIIAATIKYMRESLGIKKIGATGYCYGGRYAFRVLAPGKGADAAFAAHPSLLEDKEIQAIVGPAAIAAAETDSMMSPARRNEISTLLQKTGLPYQVSLYGGTSHGFGVRANVSDPRQKFGKEEAFAQAVKWFSTWA